MEAHDITLKVEFRNTRRKAVVPLSELVMQSVDFLEHYGIYRSSPFITPVPDGFLDHHPGAAC